MVDPKRLIESMELCRGEDRDCQKCVYWETENDCRDSMIHDAADVIKVMKQIEWERNVALDQLWQIGKGLGEKMDDIVELLKEQKPKPVKFSENAYGYKTYYCPKCGRWFEFQFNKSKYCDQCGQAVKWDE